MEAPLHVSLGKDSDASGRPAPLTAPEVSVVVVSYETCDLLRRLLASLRAAGSARASEVLVVDNASGDGTVAMLREEFADVRVIANAENVGYSRAVNQAIRAASGRYLLILNPDIEVLPGSVDALVGHMDAHPETGIAGGKLLNSDGTLQYSCRTFYTFATLLHRRTPLGKLFPNSRTVREHLMMDWDHESVREVDWMLGACLMVRREAITDVGLMDERFFMYFEDVDWCYRMKQHGWKVVYVPDARMRHLHRRESAGGGLFNPRLFAHLNSMFRFFDKWNTILYRLRKHRDLVVGGLLLLGDVLAVSAAFVAAFGLRTLLSNVLHRPVFPFAAYRPFLLLTNAVVLFLNAMLGLYRRPTARDLLDDAFDLGKGLALSTTILMASTFLTGSELYSRFMLGTFLPLALGATIAGRSLLAVLSRALRRSGFDRTRIVVLGERDAARALSARIASRPRLGLEVVATLADRPGDEERRFREFWDAEGIRELVHRHRVAEVLLVRPTLSSRELARLVLLCRRDGVRLRLVSGAADYLPSDPHVRDILGRPAVELGDNEARTIGPVVQRALDVVLAGGALFLLGPAAWVRAFRGLAPSLPHELVYGLKGRVFRRACPPRERRAETLGHVLRGELALVGPRPRTPAEVAARDELRVLFDLVRPGVTGPWRLHAKDELSPEEEVSLSLSYLQNRTPWEDLKVLLRALVPRDTP
ncbi:MAG: glycosyltransferase [bacterium]